MTESQRPDEPAREAETADVEPAETTDDTAETGAAETTAAPATGKPRRGGRAAAVLAVLALLLALAAAGGVAGLAWLGQQRADELDDRMATVEQSLETTVQDDLMPRLRQLESSLEDTTGSVSSQSDDIAELQQGLDDTRVQMGELIERIEGGTRRWKLLEIESLLAAANERLLLHRDAAGARRALELASRHIGNLGDPRLFDIREQVVDEIAALNALPDPDIEGMALTLSSLVEQVPDLVLKSEVPQNYEAEGPGPDALIDAPGWQHFVDSLGTALEGMFTIRRSDEPHQPLMPPDEAYFLHQNLTLKLQSARLALLQRQGEVYRQNLDSARKWLQTYFDTDAAGVAGALEQLNGISKAGIDWQAPDISASLVAMRAFLREQAQKRLSGNPDPNASGNNGNE
ncbi:uroporphyrinogen-III C-methyltransferase [Spectribacter hydrogenooxidans]|uniref:Uroporphyrinogen-III C-methyltransferase n=1 Tax=Spectribacter hydrogenoxidans TaxID=3075608 RepID=A0ABU3BZA6_9GAMM|nr:uroporphyrinogen-III C-methyltransferase [Salinisphaera sp. W335]MDT0634634.1 uroporphyrinogen-III C-methyltransferase [Salinisphaera sp. W335]